MPADDYAVINGYGLRLASEMRDSVGKDGETCICRR
jgi:hypothetical protein